MLEGNEEEEACQIQVEQVEQEQVEPVLLQVEQAVEAVAVEAVTDLREARVREVRWRPEEDQREVALADRAARCRAAGWQGGPAPPLPRPPPP